MTREWLVVILLGSATLLLKFGAVLVVGSRRVPRSLHAAMTHLAPALFGALLVTQTFVRDGRVALDARAVGVAAGALGAALRLPPLLVLTIAVAVTAAVRHLD